jgi:hypothetical protein
MNALAIFVLLSAALLGASWLVVRGQAGEVAGFKALEDAARPVDVMAFLNLVSYEEDEYLRSQLPGAEYRAIKRLRILAAQEYMGAVLHNAAVLIRFGDALRKSTNAEIAAQGARLQAMAVQMRVLALLVRTKLVTAYLFPRLDISARSTIRSYEELAGTVSSLCRVQAPAQAGRIAARLSS